MIGIDKTPSERIIRLKKRYQEEVPQISIERARFFTESWRETDGNGLSRSIRSALAMKNVYENMTYHVDKDDRIAGYWTEGFLGIPIDIERGVFNTVLESELDKSTIISFRMKSFAGLMRYLVKNHKVLESIRNMKMTRAMGPSPMNLKVKTMDKREINQFSIDPGDKRILKKELLPYWKGKTVVDIFERELIESGLMSKGMSDFNRAIPANTSRQTILISPCATCATLQAHVIIDHEMAVKKGLMAMKKEVEEEIDRENDLSSEELDFLKSVRIAYEGVITYSERLASKIKEELDDETGPSRRKVLERMYENCSNVPLNPPESFYQALQSAWTIKTAVEIAHPVNLHCFGRLDQILYPYYKTDLERGTITKDEARELLEELLLKIMSQNIRPESNILSNFYQRYLGSSPVTIGGLKPDGTDGTNELSYLFLEAANNSRAVTNISIRVHEDSPEDFLLAIADVLYQGSSNISLFNDDINIEAMRRREFTEEDARDYAVMGCVEMLCPGKTGGMSANALLLCRLMDMTLRNGDSQSLLGRITNVGMKTGDISDFKSFDDLVEAFLTQANYQMDMIVKASNIRDKLFAQYLPAPYISAFIEGCMENRKDVTQGGAVYDLSGISFINSIANAVDSLYVIKKLVFESKEYTLKELLDAIDSNYLGYEEIFQKIISLEGKWGNGYPEVDELARYITTQLFERTYEYESFRGGVYVPYLISMTTHTIDGRISIASPDGRKAAMPYAASCNPYNVERNGVTGVMRSVSALDYQHVLGCAVNIKFHNSAIGKDEYSRKKWVSLIKTYFQLGGAQLQPTVASSETLRQAQIEPEGYRDLIVKVGGYSAYFTELGQEIQNEVIARTEHK